MSSSPSDMVLSVLVTGGVGFVGTAIVDALREKHPEWKIVVFDLTLPTRPKIDVEYIAGDVTVESDVTRVINKIQPHAIVHTAGVVPKLADRYSRKGQDRVFQVNVKGTENILYAAKNEGVQALVWTGSCTSVTDDMTRQYPNIDERWPMSKRSLVYGESKAQAENLVLAASDDKFSACALRPTPLFGPGDYSLVPSIYSCIAKGETPFIIGEGSNLWDIMYVDNVADAHVLALENLLSSKTAAGEAFFLSNNEPLPFRDICLAIWAHFGHVPTFQVHIPLSVAVFAGHVSEWLTWLSGKPMTFSSGSVLDASTTRYVNGGKARTILGFVPRIGLEEAIRITCKDYAQRLSSKSKIGGALNQRERNQKVKKDGLREEIFTTQT